MSKMRSLTVGLMLALGMTGLTLGSAQAAPITYTNFFDFVTAVGTAPVTSEGFNGNIADGTSITFDSGVVSTLTDGRVEGSENVVRSGFFQTTVSSNANSGATNLIWTFPMPVMGFSLNFVFVGPLQVTIPELGVVVDLMDTFGGTSGYLGVIDSATAFTQIQFSVVSGNTQGFMAADDLLFIAAPAVTAVPEPGTLALFGLGLAGFAVAHRRKRAA